jgi:hypothetical protein
MIGFGNRPPEEKRKMGKIQPSSSTTKKAQLRAKRLQHMREMQYCKPISISPNVVTFTYAGYEIVFAEKNGHLARVHTAGYTYPFLNEEDFAWMYAEAAILMKATRTAINKTRTHKAKAAAKIVQDTQLTFRL